MTASRPCSACHQPVPRGDLFCPACGADAPTEAPPSSDRAAAPSDEHALAELQAHLQLALGSAFEVRRLLGRGGFGNVWEAYDVRLGRSVAVKVLRPELATSSAFRKRFHREARAVAKMRHPGIVPIYHIGEAPGLMYFIMPLVEGITLKTALDQEGRMNPDEATRILAEASAALREAHRLGIVHRDLKPENVMLEGPERRVLLMDFGIAQSQEPDRELTGGGLVLGSPEFMSPEQATGERRLDARSDIYSLGVVGYRMLSGRLPFVAETAREILTQHVLTPPEPLANHAQVPPRLAEAVMRCLAKQPDDRWQTVDELRTALLGDATPVESRTSAASLQPSPKAAPAPVVAAPRPRRRPVTLALGAGVATIAVAAAVLLSLRASDVRRREVAGSAVLAAYQAAAESLRALAGGFGGGALTGAQYRAAEASVRRGVEADLVERYGPLLDDPAAWPGDLGQRAGAARRAMWAAMLSTAALTLQPSGTAGCALDRRDALVVLRDASGTNCWWSTSAGPAALAFGVPIEYLVTFQLPEAGAANAGLGLAWCGSSARCRVLWVWLEGRVEWATHSPGGALHPLELGERVRLAQGAHGLRVRFADGGVRVWMDGRRVLARPIGEGPAMPGDLRMVVQKTTVTLAGPEALAVVGMRP